MLKNKDEKIFDTISAFVFLIVAFLVMLFIILLANTENIEVMNKRMNDEAYQVKNIETEVNIWR